MTLLLGVAGTAALFALFAFTATRAGTRLESGHRCHSHSGSQESCGLLEECGGCDGAEEDSDWWPEDAAKDGDRR